MSFCGQVDCPISEGDLAKLYRASEGSLAILLDTVEPEVKPALAFFAIGALIFKPLA